ncbi:recombinase RecT [Nonomuraea sp. CA-141351]|uniref:recombinase RecT n=1 Tax=Nonomuraea sp. CA-141351 TaxID=3239996 RepID=UPI003D90A541
MSDNLPALIEEMNHRIGKHTAEFEAALPKGVTVAQLKQDALNSLRATPKLAQAFAPTVLGALMTCAQLGLRPGVSGLGHAWLLPFKNYRENNRLEAQLIIGYRGYVDLAYRHPAVQGVVSRIRYANDRYKLVYGLDGDTLEHEPPADGGPRGEAVLYYAIARVRGHSIITEPMSRREMEEHRDKFAMAKSRERGIVGPWRDHFDEMARKTMIRARLVKAIPTALDMAIGLSVDEGVRLDFDPTANPAEVTTHPDQMDEEEAADPGQSVRESVTIRESFPSGGLTGSQDREISRLMRDRKISKEQALDLVERKFGERKSARQLSEEQAAELIEELKKIPLPTMEGEVFPPSHPSTEPDQPATAKAVRMATRPQMNMIHATLAERGITDDDAVRAEIGRILGEKIESRKDVTFDQAARVLDHLDAPDAPPAGPPTSPPMPDKDELVREHIVELIRAEWARAGGTPQTLAGAFRKAMNVGHREAATNELNAFLQQFHAGKHQPTSAAARQRAKLLDGINARFDGLDEQLSSDERLRDMSRLLNRPVHRLQDLTAEEVDTVHEVLGDCAGLAKKWDDAIKAAEAAWTVQQ